MAKQIRSERGDLERLSAEDADGDPRLEGCQRIRIFLRGEEKFVSLFDLDHGLKFYLQDEEVKELLAKGNLDLSFRVPVPE